MDRSLIGKLINDLSIQDSLVDPTSLLADVVANR